MQKNFLKRFLSIVLVLTLLLSSFPVSAIEVHAASGSLNMTAESLTASYSGDGTWSGGGTSASGSVTGKKVFINLAQSATLKLTNNRDKTASLSFSYNITKNTGSVTINGTTVTGSGTYEISLEAGDYIQIVIKSGKGTSNTTSIDLSNISLVVDSSAVTTFKTAENGSYTVNGTAITEETQITQKSTEAYALVATPASGYRLLGWYSTVVGSYINYGASASVNVDNDTTIYPVFVSDATPVFQVGTDRYIDFAEANAAAVAHDSKQMTLVEDGTLSAGTYEISAGVKLLIPFSATHTADFDDKPTYVNTSNGGGSYTTPSVYSSLTLAEGAVLNCYGSINVNGQMALATGQYASQVTGTYGALNLSAGSTLNLEDGAVLYAYGYMGGDGMVEGKSGSKIYQMMQINDWRGGQASSSLSSTMKNNSFLFSQYYLQNIEANQKINYGSTMYAVVGMTANAILSYAEEQVTAPIIGSNEGLFRLGKSGDYITMKYDSATDRIAIDLYGDISTVSINLSMNLGLYNFDMNTSEYILPIPANYTLTVKSGSTASFTEKIKLLPGTQVYVEAGATVTVGTNGAVYIYDHDDWNSGNFTYAKKIYQLKYVHAKKGAPVTRDTNSDAILQVDGSLVAYGPVYSTKQVDAGGNAGITGTGVISLLLHGTTNLIEVADSSTSPATTTITCVPAVGIVAGHEGQNSMAVGTYNSVDGKWYQYTLTLTDVNYVSGAYQGADGTMYVGDIKDTPASVIVSLADAENKPCITATNAALTENEDGNYTVSGFTGNATVKAAAHTSVEIEKKDPSCTESGLEVGVQCSVCGKILTAQEEIPALGHTEEILPAVNATCTTTGLTEGKKCSVCGDIIVAQETIPALGHTEETIPGHASSCTTDGLTNGKKCTVCGVITEEQVVIGALGHTYVSVVTAPTCTEQGYTTYTCHCGDTYVDDYTDALGHEHSVTVEGTYVAATCTTTGKNSSMKCVRCEDTVEGTEILATGHNHSEAVEGSAVLPTCTEDGKELDLKCANCNDVKTGAVIPATGHEVIEDAAVAATCTETGLTAGSHCNTCKEVLVAQETVPALGHDYKSVVTEPNCTDQGYTTHTCANCGNSYVDTYVDPIAENHTYEKGIKKVYDPTCVEQGYTVIVCDECGHEEKVEGSEVAALGHSKEREIVPGTEATCLTDGLTEGEKCMVCGEFTIAQTVIHALGHDCVPTVTYPTCTEQGYTTHNCSRCEYSHIPADSYKRAVGHLFEYSVLNSTCTSEGYTVGLCTDCGHTAIIEESRTPATGHHCESKITKAATCDENGVMTYTCWCGEYSYTEVIEATGHTYGEGVVTAPKCHEEGYTTYTCINCDHYYTDEHTTALGCEFGEWTVITPATCTEAGEQKRVCIRCDHFETTEIPATGHTYTTVVTPPTCTEEGYTTYTCACGDTYKDYVTVALGHTVVIDAGKEPTCTETGLTEGSHCSVCGVILTPQQEVAVLAHTYGEWFVSKVASCFEEGEEVRSCSVCFAQERQLIAKIPHTPMIDYGVASRYDKPGLTEGSHCSACNTVLQAQEEIPMLVLEWDTFLLSMQHLEQYAIEYAASNPGKDPVKLMINFIRTGVERYNDDEWVTLAGKAETVFIDEVMAKDDINGTHAYALRHLVNITMPNGEEMEFEHLFGALNVSSNNKYTQSYGDFGSWAGDLCDLLEYSYTNGVDATELEALVAEVTEKYFGTDDEDASGFGAHDVKADLDAYYIISKITAGETSLAKIFEEYYTATLTDIQRAAYFLNNRFAGSLTQEQVRESVYTTYKDHLLVQLLESGRGLSNEELLREACCYTFADYLYNLAKDDLVAPETPDDTPEEDDSSTDIYKVFSSTNSTVAPGVSQSTSYAMDSNGEQMVFYIATVDINRDDVNIYANYANNDPSLGWEMATVSAQMQAAQDRHSNPEDTENYIENYNVVVGQNANFYDMSNGKPNGLLVMEGVTYTTGNNFFAILKDGTPVIAAAAEYEIYQDQIQEAVGGGNILVQNGKNMMGPTNTNKMPRSCVGITADGQVVMMVLDGRQAGFSVGATYYEQAQIMLDAGCVIALELDGGGSATFDAKPEGSDEIVVVNRPNDMYERSVSSSLIVVSTAVISKEFDHAVITAPTDYLTVGSSFNLELVGVSSSGHAAEIPENAVLQVSDVAVGSIDGTTFTALARGTVDVQLVVDGNVVGTKTLEVIRRPDALKYTDNNLNLIYGVAEELPLAATYQNSPVTINVNDIIFELSNETAGTMDGFAFTGNEESGIRNVTVVAKVKTDVNITASISLRLYSSDESIFDFDSATAGNESLAWNREVENTYTMDSVDYYVTDKNGNVYADYTFALDMKAIKAPARLQPLMEYLNGFADVGDEASPWDYLLALGNRVSSLTNVTIQATFPEGVEVDLSDLTFVNDFMTIKGYTYDEETRTLTVSCGWVKQNSAEAIDPATANSIAILSGVRLIPTDESLVGGMLSIDVSGNVTYDIYLDTSQLHSFAQDSDNQETYGIYDYINPDDPEDAGGHFADTYITFEDHFNIHNESLNGWVTGGVDNDLYYYYVDNEMATGIFQATDRENSGNSYYYDFGENGVCRGIYTGLFYDELKGGWCYSKLGKIATGWQTIDGNWHYFLVMKDGLAATGSMKIAKPGVTFEFDEYGMTKGAWVTTEEGTRYYYGPGYHNAVAADYMTFVTIDGKTYNFDYNGYTTSGIRILREGMSLKQHIYEFDSDGALIRKIITHGLFNFTDGATYYVDENGIIPSDAGLVTDGKNYYYVLYSGKILKDTAIKISEEKTNGYVEAGWYVFTPEGKMLEPDFTGIRNIDGIDYYYLNGKICKDAGLVKIDNDYYYVYYSGKIAKGCQINLSEDKVNGYVEAGWRGFDDNGRMVKLDYTGLVTIDEAEYYYQNGSIAKDAGLVKIDDVYYYVQSSGKIIKSIILNVTSEKANGLVESGWYSFEATGKMVDLTFTGIVNIGGEDYCYLNGKIGKNAGLVNIDGSYYYVYASGKIFKDGILNVTSEKANELVEAGWYGFEATGKMVDLTFTGILNIAGDDYYYLNGKIGKDAGLVKVDENYYFVSNSGIIQKNCQLYISEEKANGYYIAGIYEFDADGVMVDPYFTGIKNVNGVDYYYLNGQIGKDAGLVNVDGSYYYVYYSGKIVKNQTKYLDSGKTNGLVNAGWYTFEEDGKMIEPNYTGIKNVDGVDYYYLNGKIGKDAGLVNVDGSYYYVYYSGKILKNETKHLDTGKTNGLVNAGWYTFEEDGKMIDPNYTGIKNIDGVDYYYLNGKIGKDAGLVNVDGSYYYVYYSGKILKAQTIKISEDKMNGHFSAGWCEFGTDGVLIFR